MTVLITVPQGITGTVTIPDSVTGIGDQAFYNRTGLTGVTIGNSVTNIGNSAFSGCTGLINVIFNGIITSSGFSSNSPFPGDLRAKYFAGGSGLYFTTNPGSSAVWHRSPSITAPVWSEGNAVSLDTPAVALPAGQTVTAQGWQISDTAGGGWTNFTPPVTAVMSLDRNYLRYYAVSSNGATFYSNAVIIFVFDTNNMMVTNTTEWNAVKTLISSGGNNQSYTVCISGDVGLEGNNANTFGTASGITVTLQGNGKLYLTSAGRIITLAANQTLTIDSDGLILQGLKNGQNGATQNNNTAVVYVNNSNAQLELRNGTISGNTSRNADSYGGGVYVGSGGIFTMSSGKISGNASSCDAYGSNAYGGGVYVSGGTFAMSGGEISGNASNSYSSRSGVYGGGVYVGSDGIFTMSGGEISGNTSYSSSLSDAYGGGVYVAANATFTMNSGAISGNSAFAASSSVTFSYSYGGGVYNNGTFRIVTGTVYGSNETDTSLRNTVTGTWTYGAALYGTAQRGTFNGETWVSAGNLSTTDTTIKVGDGALQ